MFVVFDLAAQLIAERCHVTQPRAYGGPLLLHLVRHSLFGNNGLPQQPLDSDGREANGELVVILGTAVARALRLDQLLEEDRRPFSSK